MISQWPIPLRHANLCRSRRSRNLTRSWASDSLRLIKSLNISLLLFTIRTATQYNCPELCLIRLFIEKGVLHLPIHLQMLGTSYQEPGMCFQTNAQALLHVTVWALEVFPVQHHGVCTDNDGSNQKASSGRSYQVPSRTRTPQTPFFQYLNEERPF